MSNDAPRSLSTTDRDANAADSVFVEGDAILALLLTRATPRSPTERHEDHERATAAAAATTSLHAPQRRGFGVRRQVLGTPDHCEDDEVEAPASKKKRRLQVPSRDRDTTTTTPSRDNASRRHLPLLHPLPFPVLPIPQAATREVTATVPSTRALDNDSASLSTANQMMERASSPWAGALPQQQIHAMRRELETLRADARVLKTQNRALRQQNRELRAYVDEFERHCGVLV